MAKVVYLIRANTEGDHNPTLRSSIFMVSINPKTNITVLTQMLFIFL